MKSLNLENLSKNKPDRNGLVSGYRFNETLSPLSLRRGAGDEVFYVLLP